jgi:hypothetical protein
MSHRQNTDRLLTPTGNRRCVQSPPPAVSGSSSPAGPETAFLFHGANSDDRRLRWQRLHQADQTTTWRIHEDGGLKPSPARKGRVTFTAAPRAAATFGEVVLHAQLIENAHGWKSIVGAVGRVAIPWPAASFLRGGAVVARWAHNPKVAGSIPAPANFQKRGTL